MQETQKRSNHLLMINFVLITTILVLMPMPITISNVNAGGPRLDYDESYEDVPGAPECWVNGYDAGFAGEYDRNRADECKDIPGDQYNRSWQYGCKDGGLTEGECNKIKSDPNDNINHESLQEENRRNCYDDGYEDGKNGNFFNNDKDNGCSEYSNSYQTGFNAGCQSVESNTADSCELTIKGYETYCPNRPDDPSCSEFLHDPSNKKHLLPTDFAPNSLTILVVLKLQILKDTASLPMIKHIVGLLEIFVMQTVL